MDHNRLLAQVNTTLGNVRGNCEGFGPLCTLADSGSGGLTAIARAVSLVVGLITLSAGIYFLIQFLIAGFEYMSASGDKNRLTKAQDRMTQSIVGLIIVVAAFGITAIIQGILQIDILLLNPGNIINTLGG